MRSLKLIALIVTCLLAPLACNDKPEPDPLQELRNTPPAPVPDDPAEKLAWPREFKNGDYTVQLYQPQIDQWDGNQLQARAAASIASGKGKPVFGVVTLTARTEVLKATRLVNLEDIKVTAASFPLAPDKQEQYRVVIDTALPDVSRDVSLDHLEANVEATAAMTRAKAVPVKNDPPKIVFVTTPTLLVLIDGAAQLRPITGQTAMRVINSRALILLDQTTGTYFLSAVGRWYAASAVGGLYAVAPAAPAAFTGIRDQLVKTRDVDPFLPDDPNQVPKTPPAILVSTVPTELIESNGEPQYTPIDGTSLLYLSSSDSPVFTFAQKQKFYVLVSGRWFTATSLQGPWAYVVPAELPPDFAKIPPDSPKGNVLVSVPGTPQADQAVIANSIPQTATVKVEEAKLVVNYDGDPQFKPFDDMKNLEYATNAVLPVLLVEEPRAYYCVSNGVWFTSKESLGPWTVATSVPAVIYTIPPSHPLHYVTYVRIYGTGPGVVYVGYTPGYMGTCVTSDGVVVYGTGYYYPAYVSTTVWYGYPPTYGYAAGFACSTATGFAFGFAASSMYGGYWGHPYWGPCWGYGSVDMNTSSVYRNWGGGVTKSRSHVEWEAGNGGNWQRKAASFNPYTGRVSAGGSKGWVEGDGDFNAKHGAASYNPRTGVVSGAGRQVNGNFDDGWNSQAGGFKYNTRTDTGVGVKGGDVYAGKDGNVYRYDRDGGGWQQRTDSGWQDTQRSPNFSQQQQNLDSQRQSRDVGQQRYNNYRSSGSSASPSRSPSGGYRGGGGGRGGGRR